MWLSALLRRGEDRLKPDQLWKRIARAIDPNDDPTAEPLSPVALATLLVFIAVSVFYFMRWRVQPMQDVGHHVAFTAVVADYGKQGSIYPAIYKPLDFLNTNSLLYTVAGVTGKLFGPSFTFRFCIGFGYLAGVPLANYYALRVFGRSAWGAVISVPLVYNISYVYGFANFLFAAPLAVIAIPLFYKTLVEPTRNRIIAIAIVTALLFLAHLHVFLWTGVLMAAMALVGIVVSAARRLLGRPGPKPQVVLLAATLSVLPALALFVNFFRRVNKPPPPDEYILATVRQGESTWPVFKAGIMQPSGALSQLSSFLNVTSGEDDLWFFVGLGGVALACIALARLHQWKRPPVLELVCAVTLLSYFLLPENFATQQIIASRQVGFGLWFASALFTPVPLRVSWPARVFAIGGVIWLSSYHMANWSRYLTKFEKEEVAGFDKVMAAAPPRLKLHYVDLAPQSKYFPLNTFWHVDKWYMAEKRGQVNANLAYGATQPIRYKSANPPYHAAKVLEARVSSWSTIPEVWTEFDLVLTHKWQPSAAELAAANENGVRIMKAGDWDLWRSKRR